MTRSDEGRPHVPARLQSAVENAVTEKEQVTQLIYHLRSPARDLSPAWIALLGEIGEQQALALTVLRQSAATLAWEARDVGQPMPSDSELNQSNRNDRGIRRLVSYYVYGQRLRFDFRFESLERYAREWLREFPDDALILGFLAFASLGSRKAVGSNYLRASQQSDNADKSSRSICLHALWLGDHVPGQAQQILELADEIIARGEDDSNHHFWRAGALRKLLRFDEAFEAVDRAITLLPIGMNAVHQDFFRERGLISATQHLHDEMQQLSRQAIEDVRSEMREQLGAAQARLNERADSAQQLVAGSLLSVIEVLGLFVALLGFLVGSGTVVLRSGGFVRDLISMALVLVGSLTFFLLLRGVLRFRTAR